jgi:hypothetical protein
MTFTSRWLDWQPDASQRAKNALAPRSALPELTEPPAEVAAEEVLSVLAVDLTGEAAKNDAEPLAPPAPRELPEPPRRDGEPVRMDRGTLDPIPGTPAAEIEADWKASLARAREGYSRHGGAPGGREANRFIRDAATLECLLRTRESEFAAWRSRWRTCLDGVYSGNVALLPGFERDLLAAWRATASPAGMPLQSCEDAGQPVLDFEVPG